MPRRVGGSAREAELAEELAWARDARAAVRRRLPEFLALLDDEPDPSVQVALAVLAAQFPEDGEEALAHVLPVARAEQNDPRRLVLELAVGALGGAVDRADLLRRLPEDYYDEEGVEELRGRFAEAADEREV